jgi:hypothetical protein
VAHAVSFLRCGPGMEDQYRDAMLVLRHSIHTIVDAGQTSTPAIITKCMRSLIETQKANALLTKPGSNVWGFHLCYCQIQ